jgi:hypothetical protein
MKNYGLDVEIWYKADSPWGDVSEVRHNVTEIHYNYPQGNDESLSIAFESDIHTTGGTISIQYIKEFEAKLATNIAEKY